MTEAEFLESLLDDYRNETENGEYTGAVKAVTLCGMHNLPMPDWVAAEATAAMRFYFRKGGAPGQGKSGGHLAKYKRSKLHRRRHHIAEWELARRQIVGGNRRAAFERASERLSGSFAQGTPEQIEKSFNSVNRDLKNAAL